MGMVVGSHRSARGHDRLDDCCQRAVGCRPIACLLAHVAPRDAGIPSATGMLLFVLALPFSPSQSFTARAPVHARSALPPMRPPPGHPLWLGSAARKVISEEKTVVGRSQCDVCTPPE